MVVQNSFAAAAPQTHYNFNKESPTEKEDASVIQMVGFQQEATDSYKGGQTYYNRKKRSDTSNVINGGFPKKRQRKFQ